MALKLSKDLFGRKRILGVNYFQLTDVNTKATAGAPSDDYPIGTLFINTADNKLYLRTTSIPETPDAAYWKLDETSGLSAADSSGNSHTATMAASAEWITGKYGGAYRSALATSHGLVSSSTDFDFDGDFCVEFYISMQSTQGGQRYIMERKDGVSGDYWSIRISPDRENINFYISAGSSNQVTINIQDVALDEWIHCAFVGDRQSGKLKAYLDGEQVDIVDLTQTPDFSNNPDLYLFSSDLGGGDPDSDFDEVKIWNSVRSVDEIKQDRYVEGEVIWASTQLS